MSFLDILIYTELGVHRCNVSSLGFFRMYNICPKRDNACYRRETCSMLIAVCIIEVLIDFELPLTLWRTRVV